MTFRMLIGLVGLIFMVDLLLPAESAGWILYFLPVLWAFSCPNPRAPVQLAVLATVLIMGRAFQLAPFFFHWTAGANRLLAVSALWGSVILLYRLRQRSPASGGSPDSTYAVEQKRLRHLFGERVKELTALHRTLRLLQDSTRPIEEVLCQIVALLPPAWQYPDITVARITFDNLICTTPTFVETPWRQTASWVTADGAKGTIEVLYREERPPEVEGPFLAEERDLINSLADSLSSYLNRRRAELALRETHERLKALSQQLMEIQETERRQLARDLHDEIGQALTVVKMNLQTMQRLNDTSAIAIPLKDSSDVIDQTLHHVRSLSLDLHPSMLDDLGLVPAIRWYLSRQAERSGWHLDVDVDESFPSPPQNVAIACFRVLQEAITNVMRHSKATQVSVSLRRHGNNLILSVHDNGVGFDVRVALQRAAQGQSMGLIGMQERIRILNGSITIDSEAGRGTDVRVVIPAAQALPTIEREVAN